jgi:hypothetical protein
MRLEMISNFLCQDRSQSSLVPARLKVALWSASPPESTKGDSRDRIGIRIIKIQTQVQVLVVEIWGNLTHFCAITGLKQQFSFS